MSALLADIVIVGAGPVGLLCAYLSQVCGLSTIIIDKSEGPLKVGRADALNARTLQLLEIVGLFNDLYPQGKTCNTSSVWANGKFVSRQSSWWQSLEGCLHKHFLMLGQPHLEKLLDDKLTALGAGVIRAAQVTDIACDAAGCLTTLSNGDTVQSRYVIGADGARSFVRQHFKVPFAIVRPKIIWAVIDGVIDTDFPKVPEIIVFQVDTSDVAWIPREGELDRFYVRMDTKEFTREEVINKINRAIQPHTLRFKAIKWCSQFAVKESVADKYIINKRVFLVGDACHIHSVNGGLGLNTGLADAFNLIWKLHSVINHNAADELLMSYEVERKAIAHAVIETSGKLVRSTRDSVNGTHATDYVDIIRQRARYITGMGVRYGASGMCGTRLFDFPVWQDNAETRVYSLLDYTQFTLLVFSDAAIKLNVSDGVNVIQIYSRCTPNVYWTKDQPYTGQAVLVRPDAYIESIHTYEE
ncbi:MAG: FAD-binding protein [Coxiellaceae bacterium]|nr:FAD-binding protein [Coxiellaceae bacterium]